MKRLAIAGLIGGALLTAWLIVHVGAPAVASALHTAGWAGLLAISGFHLIATTLMGLAWWRLQRLGKPWVFIWGRLLRDAGAEVLPFSQIGGYVLAARAPIIHGVAGAAVAASLVVDATIEFCAEIAYIALGLALLMGLSSRAAPAAPVALGLAIAILAVAAFFVLQRHGADLLARAAMRSPRRWLRAIFASASAMQAEIARIHRSERGLGPSFLLHLAAWIVSGIEAWLALRFMGVALGLAAVLAIEGLVCAARALAFMVPNALGIQEGAFIMAGAALGLPPDFALGLSLMRRGRDLLLGIPVLVTWQLFESRYRRPAALQRD